MVLLSLLKLAHNKRLVTFGFLIAKRSVIIFVRNLVSMNKTVENRQEIS